MSKVHLIRRRQKCTLSQFRQKATGELLCLLICRTFSCSFSVTISHWKINVFSSHLNHPKDLPAIAMDTARNHCVYIYPCVYIYICSCWEHLLLVDVSQFPGDHKKGQKGENAHPNSPFPHPGKSTGYVGSTSQFRLMQMRTVVSI